MTLSIAGCELKMLKTMIIDGIMFVLTGATVIVKRPSRFFRGGVIILQKFSCDSEYIYIFHKIRE